MVVAPLGVDQGYGGEQDRGANEAVCKNVHDYDFKPKYTSKITKIFFGLHVFFLPAISFKIVRRHFSGFQLRTGTTKRMLQ